MTILTSIILVVAIVAIALAIAYNVQKGTKTLEQLRANYSESEELQEIANLAKDLYNKDAQPAAVKKAPKKVVEQVETVAEVITPEVIEKVVETAQVVTEPTTVKPKKKRKYYPRKPKTNI